MLVDFQILKRLFPYLNFVAIGLSVTKIIIFYKAFGIDIMQYVDISEALGLYFGDIFYFIAFVFLIILSSLFFLHEVGDENSRFSDKVMEQKKFDKRLLTYLQYNWMKIAMNIYLAYLLSPLFILLTIILYLLSEARFKLQNRYNVDLHSTYHNIILWGTIYIWFTFSMLHKEIVTVRNGKYQGTSVTIELPEGGSQNIVSDSSSLFLGRTKTHLYFYDKKKETALIIPSDKVLRVELKNKYRWFWEYPK